MATKFDPDLPFLEGFMDILGNYAASTLGATERFFTDIATNGLPPLPSPPEHLYSANAPTSEPSGRGMGGDPGPGSSLSISLGGDGEASTPSQGDRALSQSRGAEPLPQMPQTPRIPRRPTPPVAPPVAQSVAPPVAPPPGPKSMVVAPQIPVPTGVQTAQAPMATAETVEAAVERLHRENRTTEDETRYTQSILDILAAQNIETV